MKASHLNSRTGPEGLVYGEIPQPAAGAGEVLIRVHATAVMPTEFDWYPTWNTKGGKPRPFPIVPSHEFSGTIASVGPDVSGFEIGAEVFGMNDWFANGALAEFCVAPVSSVVPKPHTLSHAQAAILPISVLTAWQALFDHAKLTNGQRVLIHAAAGAVGAFAVQFAHRCGAHVIATASKQNLDFVRELGADEAIDYKSGRFEDLIKDIDVVFDAVGGETLERSWNVLKPGGRMVTIVAQGPQASERSRHAHFVVEPNAAQLTQIGTLINRGEIHWFLDSVFPLEKASEAFAQATRSGKRGKVAVEVI